MSELFLTVLNMSLTASYVIIFVIFIRLLLKKAPKFISYALWGVVAFRLMFPFSFESMFSLMPRSTNAIPTPHDIIYQQSPQINSGIEAVDSLVNNSLPAPTIGASVNPLQIYVEIGAYIWVLGIIALLVYSIVSILVLKRQLKSAQSIENNIFEAENLKTPFVLGLIKPKIYLPVGLNTTERSYILLHEQTHIHRKDHIIKVLAFLTLSIHWFNPLVWIAFMLMSKDMELSCDERVLKEMDEDIKKPYANSLLSLATGIHILNGSPLAFGEGNVRGRIKNVLNYKKPRFWIVVVSIIAVIIVGIALLANPLGEEAIFNNVLNSDNYKIYEIQKPITFTAYIEPTWIPKNENEVIDLNKEIGKVGQIGILLENVTHRGNDIYFNFDAKQFINYDSGEFLYHGTFNEGGTVTSYNPSNAFNIYDNKNNKIDVVGQRGFGPVSKFSFGIDIENLDVIKDGFTLKFNGGILYGYSNLESIGSNGTIDEGVIIVNDILYRQSGERINELPSDAIEIGMLESILHNRNEIPEHNFQGAMLDEKYAGNLLYQSKDQDDELYLEDLLGYYIVFINTEVSQSLSDRRPMVMVNGMLYLDTGKHVPVEINDSAIIGEISSSVDQSEKPTEEGQTNFGSIGSKYAYYEKNIVILINNKWMLFERDNNIYQLNFSEVDYTRIEELQLNNINIIEEKVIDKNLSAYIFTNNENGEYKGTINLHGKSYYIGQVSMESTPEDLMGIEELQVFGKRAVKFYGILGANYAQAYYWIVEEKTEDSVFQVDGNTIEIDLDSDDKNEIVATIGTIPETRIYKLEEGKIYVSDINKSIGAKSVYLKDEGKRLFEVYFEPNKPEQYVFNKDSFIKK